MTDWNWRAFWRGVRRGVLLGSLVAAAVLAGWLLATWAAAEPPPAPRATPPLVWPDPDLRPVIPARPSVKASFGTCRRRDGTSVACRMYPLGEDAALHVYLVTLERELLRLCQALGFGDECQRPGPSP